MKKRLSALLLALLLLLSIIGCGASNSAQSAQQAEQTVQDVLDVLEELSSQEEQVSEPAEQAPEQEEPAEETAQELPAEEPAPEDTQEEAAPAIAEDGSYTTKEDVALYIHTYGHLPENFIAKKQAQALGWEGGSLEPYAPGKCIGGSHFGNYEGVLPEKDGRSYTECDIDTLGADKRGAKRIVFSNDGLIYYTEDHYETFELLYGEES